MSHTEVIPSRTPIRTLSTHLANQIAAGEVVERPASIIKELLENSLDAGARRITVTLENGGMQSITVQDDGCGIPGDELVLALAPHATSKLTTTEDLAAITSMGFRGEALASIASVSRLQLTSRFIDADSAWTLFGRHGEKAAQPSPASHPVGTTIDVAELFFNTPARRRFLRSERTEFRHCEDVVRRIALCRFDVAFTLKHNQRTVLQLPAANDEQGQYQRLVKLCGSDFLQHAQRIHSSASGLKLNGWITAPEGARPQADLQFFFVNGRIIRDRVISHALRQAYADNLLPGRYPAYVLHLELAAHELDVNVHPTKYEVRFEQTRQVHDFLSHSVRQLLASQNLVDSMPYAKQPLAYHQPVPARAWPPEDNPDAGKHHRHRGKIEGRVKDGAERYGLTGQKNGAQQTSSLGRVLGILHEEFLLFEHQDGLGLANLAQLHQALLLHQWNHEEDNAPVSQPLLIPETLGVGESLADWVEQHSTHLQRCGLDLERTGMTSIMLRQIPEALARTDVAKYLAAFLQQLSEAEHHAHQTTLALLAQHAAPYPRGGWQTMAPGEMLARLSNLSGQNPLSHPSVTVLDHSTLSHLFAPS